MPSESSIADLFNQKVEFSTGRLLVVDDEPDLLAALTQMLQKQGYEVSGCGSAEEALSALQEQDFDLLLTDLMMPKLSGIELFQAAVKIDPHLVAIMMTGQGTIQSAVEALKAGIFDYILKPFKLRAVLPVLARALEVRRLRMQNLQLRQTMAIYELGQTISHTLDLDAVLDKVVEGAMQQCEADEASIMLPTRQADELYVAAVRGPQRSHLLGERVPIDKHIVGWVARQRQPLTLSGGVKDPRFEPKRGRADILFSAILPLIVGSKFVGILNLNFTHHRRPLTVGELKALSILTTIAAATLDGTRLYRDLAESEQKLRSLLEQSIEGIVLSNGEGQIVEWNESAESIFGLKRGEVLGRKLWDVQFQVMPDERKSAEAQERLKAPLMEFLKTKEPTWLGRFMEVTVQWPDKTLRTVEMTVFPIRMDEAFMFGCIARDVTERKKKEAELQRKHTLLRTLLDNVPVYCYLKDSDCRFLMNNPAHLKVLRASKQEEVAGKTDFDFLPRERAEQYHVDEQEILRTGQPLLNKEEELIDQAGERRWVLTIKVPLRDESGSVVGIVGMGQDITEHKQLEEQFLQAQKMEAVGRLAGGIAHDFNNMMMVVNGYSDILLSRLETGDPLRSHAEKIKVAGKKAAALTDQLLSFSRRKVIQPITIDLNEVVNNLQKMLQGVIGEDIELVFRPGEALGKVKADPAQIDQVLMNLIVNARDAMPTGGKLTIETKNMELDEEYTRRHFSIRAGSYVMLAVSDTGIGMDKETQSRIFEPFFTTKGEGKGTGLGLATVHGIVQQSGGQIGVYSEPGKGSNFKIYLPRVREEGEKAEARKEAEKSAKGSETILLVENEEMVCEMARGSLLERGYTVLEARDGEEGLQVSKRHEGAIHVLVTDVVMPKMSGPELAKRLKEERPGIEVIYISGFTDEAITHHGILEPGLNFIQKPFSPADLTAKVRGVLDAHRDEGKQI